MSDRLIAAAVAAGMSSADASDALLRAGILMPARTVRHRAATLGHPFAGPAQRPAFRAVLAATTNVVARLGHGWGYSKITEFIQTRLLPGTSRRQVIAAMKQLAPRSFAARAAEPFQRRLRGHLVLPHRNLWWQLDLDCKLQDWGLYVAGVIDAHDRTLLALVVLPDKTAVRIWHQCVAVALSRAGLYPEMLSTDMANELKLVGFACEWAHRRGGAPPGTFRLPPHRAMPSKRNIRIERLWGELNPKALYSPKAMLLDLERAGLLDPANLLHMGAVQLLLRPLLQFGVDDFAAVHNTTTVRSTKGHGGVPLERRAARAHPQEALLPRWDPTEDVLGLYEQAAGEGLPRPHWLDTRDPLHGQPARQAARAQAVMLVWGSVERAWLDVLHMRGVHVFIPSYRMFLYFR